MSDRDDSVKRDDLLVGKAKALFDDSVRDLDAATLSRLNQSRQLALEKAAEESTTIKWKQWVPAAGVTAAAVFAVVLWTGNRPVDVLTPPSTVSDFEILLEGDDFEMLEDLDFYRWIELDDSSASNVG